MSTTLIRGDHRKIRELEAESVNMVMTSPPFWGLRDYGVPPSEWKDGWEGCLGLEPTPTQFVEHLMEVLDEIHRILHPTGVVLLNLGDSYLGSSKGAGSVGKNDYVPESGSEAYYVGKDLPEGCKPKDMAAIPWLAGLAARERGWFLRGDIIWAKGSSCQRVTEDAVVLAARKAGCADTQIRQILKELDLFVGKSMPYNIKDRPVTTHEYILLLAKSRFYYYDWYGCREEAVDGHRNLRSVWNVTPGSYTGNHRAVFPVELARQGIRAFSPRLVCSSCGHPWMRRCKEGILTLRPPKKTPEVIDGEWGSGCSCEALARKAVVLDPFGGTGTVAAAAEEFDLDTILVDVNPDVLGEVERRLGKGEPDGERVFFDPDIQPEQEPTLEDDPDVFNLF